MGKLVDLRSDTVTRPSEGMRRAMMAAELGDDVFGDDPTVTDQDWRCIDDGFFKQIGGHRMLAHLGLEPVDQWAVDQIQVLRDVG